MNKSFELISKQKPSGDQLEAIEKLVSGTNNGTKEQVLLGATGSGKTFTKGSSITKRQKRDLMKDKNY